LKGRIELGVAAHVRGDAKLEFTSCNFEPVDTLRNSLEVAKGRLTGLVGIGQV
jgi:hypothetical protein